MARDPVLDGRTLDPDDLAAAARSVHDAPARRDAMIREFLAAGGTQSDVAEATGLSFSQIYRIAREDVAA